jgi:hypothetical protein
MKKTKIFKRIFLIYVVVITTAPIVIYLSSLYTPQELIKQSSFVDYFMLFCQQIMEKISNQNCLVDYDVLVRDVFGSEFETPTSSSNNQPEPVLMETEENSKISVIPSVDQFSPTSLDLLPDVEGETDKEFVKRCRKRHRELISKNTFEKYWDLLVRGLVEGAYSDFSQEELEKQYYNFLDKEIGEKERERQKEIDIDQDRFYAKVIVFLLFLSAFVGIFHFAFYPESLEFPDDSSASSASSSSDSSSSLSSCSTPSSLSSSDSLNSSSSYSYSSASSASSSSDSSSSSSSSNTSRLANFFSWILKFFK